MKEIKLTAALPTYNNSDIIWLQLESLCRQQCNFKWELIICEEKGTPKFFGEEKLLEYKDRLSKAGCVNFTYLSIDERIPLSKKWYQMAQIAQGETFSLCASDDYSSPDRFELSHQSLSEGYDWFNIKKGLFLHVKTRDTATFVAPNERRGLTMSTKTSILKNIKPNTWPSISVDAWMQSFSRKFYSHPDNVKGLDTDGANTLCLGRYNMYKNKNYSNCANEKDARFIKAEQTVEEILPKAVIQRLDEWFPSATPNTQ